MSVVAASVGAVALGVGTAVLLVTDPGRARLPRHRRRPVAVEGEGALAEAAEAATSLMDRLIRSRSGDLARHLDLAGFRTRPQDFTFLILLATVLLVAAVVVFGGGLLALPIGSLV